MLRKDRADSHRRQDKGFGQKNLRAFQRFWLTRKWCVRQSGVRALCSVLPVEAHRRKMSAILKQLHWLEILAYHYSSKSYSRALRLLDNGSLGLSIVIMALSLP